MQFSLFVGIHFSPGLRVLSSLPKYIFPCNDNHKIKLFIGSEKSSWTSFYTEAQGWAAILTG